MYLRTADALRLPAWEFFGTHTEIDFRQQKTTENTHIETAEVSDMKKGMKKSDVVTQFIQLTDVAKQISIVASDEVHKQDLLTNDFLHQLELGSAKERNKIATQIATSRKDRRYYKDQIEEVQALLDWMESNKKALNDLKQVLGKMRKTEEWHEDRVYVPRVLPAEAFEWQIKVLGRAE